MQTEQNEQVSTTQSDERCNKCDAVGEVGCHELDQGTVVSTVYCNQCWAAARRGVLK